MKLVECVPNFSEGRRKDVIEMVVSEARTRNVRVLDIESDANHNRSVLTFVGSPDDVKDAALAVGAKAIELIDLNAHQGQHPRMGALDVVPFIPLSEVTMEDCVRVAKEFASEFASRFNVPVYLYGEAAVRPERRDLADVRKGEFEGLREEIGRSEERHPDFGPDAVHPTAGATAVGARKVLIAYNVNLRTGDIGIAKHIAKQVRARDGGLAFVKALGFELKDREMVQVSMNLLDYKSSQLFKAFELVRLFAERSGADVAESEIVGLLPMEALAETAEFYLKLRGFSKNQILEQRLLEVQSQQLIGLDLASFAAAVASEKPTPGGGSVSAYVACLAAALLCMVSRLTLRKNKPDELGQDIAGVIAKTESLQRRLLKYVDEDSASFMRVMRAYRLPKATEDERKVRSTEVQSRLKDAAEVPLATGETAAEILQLSTKMAEFADINVVSDLKTAIHLAHAAALGALANVSTNLSGVQDEEYRRRQEANVETVLVDVEETRDKALAVLDSRQKH